MSEPLLPKPLLVIGRGPWGRNIAAALDSLRVPCGVVGRNWRDVALSAYSGVIIASPAGTHYDIAIDLLEHTDLPLFIEKPLAMSLREAELLHLYAARGARPRVVAVDYTDIFNANWVNFIKRDTQRLVAGGDSRAVLLIDLVGGIRRPDCLPIWDYGSHGVAMALNFMARYAGAADTVAETVKSASGSQFLGGTGSIQLNFQSGRMAIITIRLTEGEKARRAKAADLVYDGLATPPAGGMRPLTRALQVFVAAIRGKGLGPSKQLCQYTFELGLEVTRVLEMLEPGR